MTLIVVLVVILVAIRLGSLGRRKLA
jgi:hypothetical protein